MNTLNTTPVSHVGPQAAGTSLRAPSWPLYWLIRRELWENRAIYIAPLTAAVAFLFGYMINLGVISHRLHVSRVLDPEKQHEALATPYGIASVLIMGTAFIIGVFYSLDALYGERRDRSILFWKSLPVSDLSTVLSKVTIPLAVLPLFSFVITIVTQSVMLLMSSIVLGSSGIAVTAVWEHSSFLRDSLMLLYHLVTVHGLWDAPIYGWMMLVSAWAPRAPFIWAFLPPFLICGLEKLAFNTTHFLDLLWQRLAGPAVPVASGANLMDVMASPTPVKFLSEPGLWVGLAIAAAFLAGAARMRRYRGPI